MNWITRQRSKIGSIAAISVGDGPLVLMIYGVGLRADAWAAQIDELAKAHRVVAVDMPGMGKAQPSNRRRSWLISPMQLPRRWTRQPLLLGTRSAR